ncbi:PD-(D/E)XK nuclease family protein [Pseudoscardovia radai]|uniref:PD-(D/E)XK nuclease family protein n=1 Tax=Pseudoscardovia radai TaxID=987066 RepID=UPI0039941209
MSDSQMTNTTDEAQNNTPQTQRDTPETRRDTPRNSAPGTPAPSAAPSSDKPLAWLDGEGLHFDDAKTLAAVRRKPVSATMISGLVDRCPAQYLFSDKLKDLVIPVTPQDARIRGIVFHRACELYYARPDARRGAPIDPEAFEECKTKALEEHPEVRNDPEASAWLEAASRRFCAMGPEATDVTVAGYRDDRGRQSPALEMKVTGRLDGVGRRVFGAIDRLITPNPDNPRNVVIDDYKTGGKACVYSDRMRFPDFSYQRQQTLYSMLLEGDTRTFSDGWHLLGGRLIYPMAEYVTLHDDNAGTDVKVSVQGQGAIIRLDVRNPEYRRRTLDDAAKASDALDRESETNLFEYRPSVLCAWCPLAKICPAARIGSKENAQKAFADQPDAQTLAPAIVRA